MNIFDFYSPIYDWFMKFWRLYKPEAIIRALEPKKKEIILDIGGGTGYIANQISKKCKKVIVLDSSAKMLRQAKKYKNPKLILCNASALSVPYKKGYFDAVVFTGALHHINNSDLSLKEAYRVLKKNGKIVILEFSKKSFIGKILYLFEIIYVEAIKFFRPEELRKKCLKAGFQGEIKKISRGEYLFIGKK